MAVPVISVLHGEDEFAIAQYVVKIEAELGDPAMLAMNTTRLDGQSFNPEELLSVAAAMPFLSSRRLVVFTNFLVRLTTDDARKKFIEQLGKIPPTTALVLIRNGPLTSDQDKKKNKTNWFEQWAKTAGERVFIKEFIPLKGSELFRAIQERAVHYGGQISAPAAAALAGLVDNDPRLADQEIQKLLAYVNYQRRIEQDDVQLVTADAGQGDVFALVDALGNQDSRKALRMLRRLLEQQEPSQIFGMMIRQFRLLLQTREILDSGGHKAEVMRSLKTPGFVADKMIGQARRFTLPVLEKIYHRLLDLDESVKTGQAPIELALETFTAELTL
ncbi:MAG: DNA polymerase III subunit delta [Anaerolineales bacterium]|nr:DNA polymerase III subunit delta [Anaerolineales bacterium]